MTQPNMPPQGGSAENNRVLIGVLAIVLGGFGVHRFMLGDVTGGIIRIVLWFLCGIGSIIGLIEGIIYLTKTDEQFNQEYVIGKKAWF